MRRSPRAFILSLVLVCLAGSPVFAASPSLQNHVEMLVLLPDGQHLAVYEQVSVAPARTVELGVMPHATDLHAAADMTAHPGPGVVILHGAGTKFAVRYKVGWNGRSGSYRLPFEQSTAALIVLLPATLRLPSVLNPALALAGHGKIPGVAGSPEFNEYTTAQIPAGDAINLVLEHRTPSLSGVAVPFNTPRLPKALGTLLQAAIACMALAGVGAAVRLRPLPACAAPAPGAQDRLLGELAILDATFRRGELAKEVYAGDRAALLEQLRQVWPGELRGG